ncbi:MAG: efflux RND transporter periplasmic adaptor subunit [Silvibacterium sp.]
MPSHLARRLSFAVAALVFISGCRKDESAPSPQVEVQAVIVHRQPITQHIAADAILSPLSQAVISSQISAPVKRFFVQRGSKVSKGELLALLDNTSLKAAVIDNQGSYDAAQAQYQTATKATVPEDIQKANLDLAQAQANLNLNLQIVKSRKHLFAEGAIPGRDLDTAQAALVQAQASFDLARQHFLAVQQVGGAAALKSAQGDLESAKGKYLGAEAQLQYSEVRSPIKGVVTDRPLYAGETAVAGAPLLTVMDTSSLLAKVHLTQPQAQQLKVGDPASVMVPGIADPVPGKLTLISPALDPGSTTVEVWVLLSNPAGSLKPGTAVHILLAGRTVPNALVVPTGSLVTSPAGKKAVMVVGVDGIAHMKEVSTGIEDNGFAQVLIGISSGDQVITNGAYALDDGTKVKVVAGTESESGAPGDSN